MEPPTPVNHFPWTTSIIVFVIDKDGRILLKKNENKLSHRLDLTDEVDIRKIVCRELYSRDIVTYHENLKHQGIVETEGRNVFVYTVDEFATDSPVPSTDSSWYTRSEIPFDKLHGFDKYILTMILDREKIGF